MPTILGTAAAHSDGDGGLRAWPASPYLSRHEESLRVPPSRRRVPRAREGHDRPQQRDQLLEMAATWARLAEDRAALVKGHPELAVDGEAEEESLASAKL